MKQDITIYGTKKKPGRLKKSIIMCRCKMCMQWMETRFEKKVVHGAKENYDCWYKYEIIKRQEIYRAAKLKAKEEFSNA